MALARAQIDFGGNYVQGQRPGDTLFAGKTIASVTTAGSATLTPANITSGVINRTGPAAGFTDTFPTADSIFAAEPELDVGDSFELIYINTVAFAMTAAAGEGIVLGANVNVALSAVRKYLLTVLGDGRRQAFNAQVTNASPIITGVDALSISIIRVGQGITGTGIPANSFVTSVNTTSGSFTINANATATSNNALTTFPRIRVDGLFSATL